MRIMDVLADATNTIAEGEVLQLLNCNDPDTDEEPLPAGDPAQDCQAVRGRRADCRDSRGPADRLRTRACPLWHASGHRLSAGRRCARLQADTGKTGKRLGDDLAEGKPTLPLIYAMVSKATERNSALIRERH